jgi:uncharacterized protein
VIVAHPAPTIGTDRIESIDVLRGVAVLGILLMNVRTFALPSAAYASPVFGGGDTSIDSLAFIYVEAAASLKFMAIFSFLFGAGVMLFTSRLERRSAQSGQYWYRRMLWLLAIGLCHAWLLWWGDILVAYAACGMLVYPLRRLKPLTQAGIGLALLVFGTTLWWGIGEALTAAQATGSVDYVAEMSPSPEQLEAERAAWRGSWLDQSSKRISLAVELETFVFAIWLLWRCGGLMLLGMACYKWGLFSRNFSRKTLGWLAVGGICAGAPLVAIGLAANITDGWEGISVSFGNSLWNYWGSLGVAAFWTALVLLICRTGAVATLCTVLASVGRMALTNYLAQSVLCGVIFYGWGFGWHGELGYASQLMAVMAVWVLQLAWSPLWLRAFRFGPVEWLWRSLTYWQLQPMRRGSLHSEA